MDYYIIRSASGECEALKKKVILVQFAWRGSLNGVDFFAELLQFYYWLIKKRKKVK